MDPYQAPKATIADPAAGLGSPVKAVVLGLLTDVGGTFLGNALIGVVYSAYLAAHGVGVDRIPEEMQAAFQQGWGFALATAVGSACSLLGGYVCARISRRQDLTLAWVLAILSVGFGLFMARGTYAVGELFSLSALTVACIVVGTKLGMRRTPAHERA